MHYLRESQQLLWWFQHDNSTPFQSREVQNWLHNHAVSIIDVPPHSSDLNHIISCGTSTQIYGLTTSYADADVFICCWPEISFDIFTDYAQSMLDHIAAVIEANGYATKF